MIDLAELVGEILLPPDHRDRPTNCWYKMHACRAQWIADRLAADASERPGTNSAWRPWQRTPSASSTPCASTRPTVLPWRTKATGVRLHDGDAQLVGQQPHQRWHVRPRAVAAVRSGAAASGIKKTLRPEVGAPNTESSSERVTRLLPMIWMEDEDAMRKAWNRRGKSCVCRWPTQDQQRDGAGRGSRSRGDTRRCDLAGMRPRLDRARDAVRAETPSSSPSSQRDGGDGLTRSGLRSDASSGLRLSGTAQSTLRCGTIKLLPSGHPGRPPRTAVARFGCESIFATPESGREICHPNYNVVSRGLVGQFRGIWGVISVENRVQRS